MTDTLGDYLKNIESFYRHYIKKESYIYIRLDGRAFSSLTNGIEHNDSRMIDVMQHTTAALVKHFHFSLGYCQSDEISLVFNPAINTERSEHIFGGKTDKLLSVIPSYASSYFTKNVSFETHQIPCFDARIVECDRETVENFLYWRYLDCKKNGVSSYAHAYFSNKELHGKKYEDRVEMLLQKKINPFENPFFTFGTFIYKKEIMTRTPHGKVPRTKIIKEPSPQFYTVNDIKNFCSPFLSSDYKKKSSINPYNRYENMIIEP